MSSRLKSSSDKANKKKGRKKSISNGPTIIDNEISDIKEDLEEKRNFSSEITTKKSEKKEQKESAMEAAPMFLGNIENLSKTKKTKRRKKKSCESKKETEQQDQIVKKKKKKEKSVDEKNVKNSKKRNLKPESDNLALIRADIVKDAKNKDTKNINVSKKTKNQKETTRKKRKKLDKLDPELPAIKSTPVYDVPPLKPVDSEVPELKPSTKKALDIITQGLKPIKKSAKLAPLKATKPLPLQTFIDTITVDLSDNAFSPTNYYIPKGKKKIVGSENVNVVKDELYALQIDLIMPPDDTQIEERATMKFDISTLLKEIKNDNTKSKQSGLDY